MRELDFESGLRQARADSSGGGMSAPVISHTIVFRPGEYYGEPHEFNGEREYEDSFYFTIENDRKDYVERLSSYLSRETFNHVAGLFGLPTLAAQTDDLVTGDSK